MANENKKTKAEGADAEEQGDEEEKEEGGGDA